MASLRSSLGACHSLIMRILLASLPLDFIKETAKGGSILVFLTRILLASGLQAIATSIKDYKLLDYECYYLGHGSW